MYHSLPLPMGFSRQEYWNELPCPCPGDLSNPGLPHCRQIVQIWTTWEAREYWNGYSIPSPGGLPKPGIEPGSPALQADSLPAGLARKPVAAAAAKSLQWYPTLCDPIDGSPAGSPVPGFSEFDWQSFFLMVCKIMMCLNCDFLDWRKTIFYLSFVKIAISLSCLSVVFEICLFFFHFCL